MHIIPMFFMIWVQCSFPDGGGSFVMPGLAFIFCDSDAAQDLVHSNLTLELHLTLMCNNMNYFQDNMHSVTNTVIFVFS